MTEKKAKEPEPVKYKVTVLGRKTIKIHKTIGELTEQVLITYTAAGLAPQTIFIMKDDYTLELEKKLILEAIEKRLKEKAESYEV